MKAILFGCLGLAVFLAVYAAWCLLIVEAAVWYAEKFIL